MAVRQDFRLSVFGLLVYDRLRNQVCQVYAFEIGLRGSSTLAFRSLLAKQSREVQNDQHVHQDHPGSEQRRISSKMSQLKW